MMIIVSLVRYSQISVQPFVFCYKVYVFDDALNARNMCMRETILKLNANEDSEHE